MTDGNIFFKKKKRKIQEHMKNKTQHLMCVLVAQSCPTVTPWTVAPQAPLSMGFSRQEYWSELPCPSPGNLPDPGIKPASPTSPALADGFFTSTTLEATYQDAVDKISCAVEFGKCFPVGSLRPVAHFIWVRNIIQQENHLGLVFSLWKGFQ